jgi:hypothetical protein
MQNVGTTEDVINRTKRRTEVAVTLPMLTGTRSVMQYLLENVAIGGLQCELSCNDHRVACRLNSVVVYQRIELYSISRIIEWKGWASTFLRQTWKFQTVELMKTRTVRAELRMRSLQDDVSRWLWVGAVVNGRSLTVKLKVTREILRTHSGGDENSGLLRYDAISSDK